MRGFGAARCLQRASAAPGIPAHRKGKEPGPCGEGHAGVGAPTYVKAEPILSAKRGWIGARSALFLDRYGGN